MKESTTYQAILREGEEKGLEKGLEKGWKKGALAEARKALLIVGEQQWGEPDQHTRSSLERIQEIERLEELMARLPKVTSWRELLEHSAARRRHGRQQPRP